MRSVLVYGIFHSFDRGTRPNRIWSGRRHIQRYFGKNIRIERIRCKGVEIEGTFYIFNSRFVSAPLVR